MTLSSLSVHVSYSLLGLALPSRRGLGLLFSPASFLKYLFIFYFKDVRTGSCVLAILFT